MNPHRQYYAPASRPIAGARGHTARSVRQNQSSTRALNRRSIRTSRGHFDFLRGPFDPPH